VKSLAVVTAVIASAATITAVASGPILIIVSAIVSSVIASAIIASTIIASVAGRGVL
jgi:hypothetical protein